MYVDICNLGAFQKYSLAALVRYFQKAPRSQISTYQHRSVLLSTTLPDCMFCILFKLVTPIPVHRRLLRRIDSEQCTNSYVCELPVPLNRLIDHRVSCFFFFAIHCSINVYFASTCLPLFCTKGEERHWTSSPNTHHIPGNIVTVSEGTTLHFIPIQGARELL